MFIYLFKVDGQLFLDLAPNEHHDDFIPAHYLVKVIQIEPTLRVTMLDHDWVQKLVAAEPHAVGHLKIKTGDKPDDYRIVFSGDTTELQAFITTRVKSPDAWSEPDELKREPAPAEKSTKPQS